MCDEGAGYLGAPTTDIYCLADSQWSNVSGCVLVDCNVPEVSVWAILIVELLPSTAALLQCRAALVLVVLLRALLVKTAAYGPILPCALGLLSLSLLHPQPTPEP